MKQHNFKIGDEVRILPTKNIMGTWQGRANNAIFILTEEDINEIDFNPMSFTLGKNKYQTNYELADLELVNRLQNIEIY